MLPKTSIVIIGAQQKPLQWVAQVKPVSVIVVNERGGSRPERPWENNEIDMLRAAMGASPETLIIFRSWPDGMGEEDKPLPYRVAECFLPFEDMPNPKMGHSYNEPGFPWIQTSGDARNLALAEIGFAQAMHSTGLLSMNFCFSESHLLKGNMGLWSIYAEALPYVDALGFNEYDWPWVLQSRDEGYKWRVGHWEHQVERLRKILGDNWAIPPIIIGEGILDGKVAKVKGGDPYGWQNRWNPDKYIEQHQQAYDDTYHRPEVFAHHTFCYCGPESEWRTYNVEPILPRLGQLIQGQVYWKEKKMNNPIKVGIRKDYKVWNSPVVEVKEMEMEEYLRYCVPYEVYPSWKPEALKAQAVAARTFATWMKTHGQHVFQGKHVDLCNSACCQVMGPNTFASTDKAVKETEGVIITYQGQPIKAEYFNFCGGITQDGGLPYQKPVMCRCPEVAPKNTVKAKHNRGMCQWGAEEAARNSGATYKQILWHYYQGVEVGGEKAPASGPDISAILKEVNAAQASLERAKGLLQK